MCGASLEVALYDKTVKCEYCNTVQTLPKLGNEKIANLYDRAGHFRRNSEFDKAMGLYEQILNEDTTDAEAYWSIVLCRYGIEYVEDLASKRRVPTINRTQTTSIYADENYKSALKYADESQRKIYEDEANEIDKIQKAILEISNKEKPFDIFICYKETDESGRRTRDSVLATELYHELVRADYKVFFSRITLEDKLGSEYEPYIFAALNSAKVMVVLGTKPEYFNSPWVKNEWARFLALIKNGARKCLIPAYKDMDPYDLPEEFSHLQAQDMSKLGFIQDIIHGIKKLTEQETSAHTATFQPVVTVTEPVSSKTAPLLDRAFACIEDGNVNKANELLEQVLTIDSKCGKAYWGLFFIEYNKKRLPPKIIGIERNYIRAVSYADEQLKEQIYNEIIKIYRNNWVDSNSKLYVYTDTGFMFKNLIPYKESAHYFNECKTFIVSEVKKRDTSNILITIISVVMVFAVLSKILRDGIEIGPCLAAIVLFGIVPYIILFSYRRLKEFLNKYDII